VSFGRCLYAESVPRRVFSENRTNGGIEGDVRDGFAADEEGCTILAREMKEAADVIVLVECGEESLCLFPREREGGECYGVAEPCGKAGVATDNLAKVLHRRECNPHRRGGGRASTLEETPTRVRSKTEPQDGVLKARRCAGSARPR